MIKIFTKNYGFLNPGDSIPLEKNLLWLNVNAYCNVPPDLLIIQDEKIYGFSGNVWCEADGVIGYYYK